MACDLVPGAEGFRQEEERTGDSVGGSEIGVPPGEAVAVGAEGIVADPPAGPVGPVEGVRLREGDQIFQDVAQRAAARVGAQEIGADAGEAVEEVVVGEGQGEAAPKSLVGRIGAAMGECGDPVVEGGAGVGVEVVPAGWGRAQEKRDGGGPEEQAAGVACVDLSGGGFTDQLMGAAPGSVVPGPFDEQQGPSGGASGEGLSRIGGAWRVRSALLCQGGELPEQCSGGGGGRRKRHGVVFQLCRAADRTSRTVTASLAGSVFKARRWCWWIRDRAVVNGSRCLARAWR